MGIFGGDIWGFLNGPEKVVGLVRDEMGPRCAKMPGERSDPVWLGGM